MHATGAQLAEWVPLQGRQHFKASTARQNFCKRPTNAIDLTEHLQVTIESMSLLLSLKLLSHFTNFNRQDAQGSRAVSE